MNSVPEKLSHSEIWDDSTLINSWNDALEEYRVWLKLHPIRNNLINQRLLIVSQKYHSIHRKGGNVEELLNQSSRTASDAKNSTEEADEPSSNRAPNPDPEMKEEVDNGRQEDGTSTSQHSHPPGGGPGPEGLLGSVRDENLKRLLMSWYYAGYYTGLYEGQRVSSEQ
ncbi:hypothetical protein GGS23DRAFT_597578 [Durotheca rogersii]|uniref:uncharacterized protein n=1 Tax=Durotheca rogersii TaxID=419775 RepID=UPI0022204D50|nr:uncharacterized protein GGS23DRAFT_597578 [Durotheca rogersii]KAI5862356.1 hypothetical protein GGS23DRAFT_597578 [Durotheca rogersii]